MGIHHHSHLVLPPAASIPTTLLLPHPPRLVCRKNLCRKGVVDRFQHLVDQFGCCCLNQKNIATNPDTTQSPSRPQQQIKVHVSDLFSSPATNPNPNRFQFHTLSGKTAITFAYELGLRRSSARWKANEKFNLKIHKPISNSFARLGRIQTK